MGPVCAPAPPKEQHLGQCAIILSTLARLGPDGEGDWVGGVLGLMGEVVRITQGAREGTNP